MVHGTWCVVFLTLFGAYIERAIKETSAANVGET